MTAETTVNSLLNDHDVEVFGQASDALRRLADEVEKTNYPSRSNLAKEMRDQAHALRMAAVLRLSLNFFERKQP